MHWLLFPATFYLGSILVQGFQSFLSPVSLDWTPFEVRFSVFNRFVAKNKGTQCTFAPQLRRFMPELRSIYVYLWIYEPILSHSSVSFTLLPAELSSHLHARLKMLFSFHKTDRWSHMQMISNVFQKPRREMYRILSNLQLFWNSSIQFQYCPN